jgi:hypothetical protein
LGRNVSQDFLKSREIVTFQAFFEKTKGSFGENRIKREKALERGKPIDDFTNIHPGGKNPDIKRL